MIDITIMHFSDDKPKSILPSCKIHQPKAPLISLMVLLFVFRSL
jgi:hypothetical protein